MEEPHAFSRSDLHVADLKAAVARYEELRTTTHIGTRQLILAGSRLRAMIIAKQLISAEPSELLEAAYAEASTLLGLLDDLVGALADFDAEA